MLPKPSASSLAANASANLRPIGAWLVVLCLALPLSLTAQEGAPQDPAAAMDPAAMDAFVAAMSPGEQHQYLERYVGDWSYEQSMWSDPTQPALKASGESTKSMIMGDRYLQEEMRGEMMGQPFYGRAVTGYDNLEKVLRSTWIDNFSTGIVVSEGKLVGDEDGHTLRSEFMNPMNGESEAIRMVTRYIDEDNHIFEYYVTNPAGQEFRQMVIEYTRLQ